jgi:hypothetical protein
VLDLVIIGASSLNRYPHPLFYIFNVLLFIWNVLNSSTSFYYMTSLDMTWVYEVFRQDHLFLLNILALLNDSSLSLLNTSILDVDSGASRSLLRTCKFLNNILLPRQIGIDSLLVGLCRRNQIIDVLEMCGRSSGCFTSQIWSCDLLNYSFIVQIAVSFDIIGRAFASSKRSLCHQLLQIKSNFKD